MEIVEPAFLRQPLARAAAAERAERDLHALERLCPRHLGIHVLVADGDADLALADVEHVEPADLGVAELALDLFALRRDQRRQPPAR